MSENKEYVITGDQLKKLAFGQCYDFEGIVNVVKSRPLSEGIIEITQREWDRGYNDGCSAVIADLNVIEQNATKRAEENIINQHRWARPLCFGKHESICDTRCPWSIRKRCVGSIRG